MLHHKLRLSCVGVIALVGIVYALRTDAQTIAPAYSSQLRVDKLLDLAGPATQMAWGPDGRLYIRILNIGVDSYAYDKTTGTLSDPKRAVAGFPGIGLAFHQNHMYLTTMDSGSLTVFFTTRLTTSNNVRGNAGETVPLQATLRRNPDGAAVPGKTVTFRVDNNSVGAAVTGSNGSAVLNYAIPATLAPGNHTITVTFAGDSSYQGSSASGTLRLQRR